VSAAGGKEKQTLTIDVLMHALRQKGVNIYKPSIIKVRVAAAAMLEAIQFVACRSRNFFFDMSARFLFDITIGFWRRDCSGSSRVRAATSRCYGRARRRCAQTVERRHARQN
jgi:hypothetical protein